MGVRENGGGVGMRENGGGGCRNSIMAVCYWPCVCML